MSPENFNIPAKPKEETRKAGQNRSLQQQQQQQDQPHINCPRCDSPNTKFCYYNNYSLTQPRHFCKTCRRYWTKGGALRNVPIGGGCRKTKKANTSSSSSTSRLSVFGEHFSSGESSDQIGLKFFHGGNNNNSNISPAMDFQLGSSSLSLIPRSQYPSQNSIYTQFSISPNTTNSSVGASTIDPIRSSLLGLNFPLKSQCEIGIGGGGGGSGSDSIHQSMNVHTNLASSIESLSCMNQDLHWKLQQQRLAMLFGGGSGSGSVGGGLDHVDDHDLSKKGANFLEIQSQKLQPILFQNLEISKKDGPSGGGGSGDMATEWFFDGSYNNAPIISNGGPRNLVQDHQSQQKYDGANGNDEDHNSTTWNNGIQAWNDLHQFSSNLP